MERGASLIISGELELENGRISVDDNDRRVYLYPVLREWAGYGAPRRVRITVEDTEEEDS